jgi:hypothetical protein
MVLLSFLLENFQHLFSRKRTNFSKIKSKKIKSIIKIGRENFQNFSLFSVPSPSLEKISKEIIIENSKNPTEQGNRP